MLTSIKNIINITLLFSTVVLFSQSQNKVRITYDVGMVAHKTGVSLTKGQKRYNDFVKSVAKKRYILDFRNDESIFYMNEKMETDVNYKPDIISTFVGKGIYYYNAKSNKTLNQKNALGEDFIIESNVKYNWKLSQEKKKIGNYICYKATTIEKFIDRKGGIKTKKIIAWYYPDISINIGIKDYHSLPGIIIFLQVGDIYYECVKIELNSKEKFNIEKPMKGRIISKKEYDNILKGDFEKRFGFKN